MRNPTPRHRYPAIPDTDGSPESINAALNAVRRTLEIMQGAVGRPKDRVVTIQDLLDLKMVTQAGLDAPGAEGAAYVLQADLAARQVLAGGLLTGGGTLDADVTITGTEASQALAEAGSDNTTLMTPLRTAQAIEALGGAVEFVSSWTYSGDVSSVSFTDLEEYLRVIAVFYDVDPEVNNPFQCRLSTNNGSSYLSGASDYTSGPDTTDNKIDISEEWLAGSEFYGVAFFDNFNVARKTVVAAMTYLPIGGHSNAAAAHNAIQFRFNGGDFDGGTIDIYGVPG